MLRYFRINDPYRLVGLFVLMTLVFLPLFLHEQTPSLVELRLLVVGEKLNEDVSMYVGLIDSTAPFAAWLSELLDTLFGRSILARHILAFLLIFIQAAFIGIIFIVRKVFNENTYIPSFLYILLCYFSFDNLAFSGELVGLTFLLFALNSMFKELEFRVQVDENVFNIGLFISIASLFHFSYSLLLLFGILVLVFFTRSSPRKFALLFVGFLIPHLLFISISYVRGGLGDVWEYFYLANLSLSRNVLISVKSLVILSAIPAVYFVVSMVMLQREARFSKYQSQVLQILVLWICFGFIYIFITKDLRPQSLILFVPALSFLISHFLLFIRRKRFAEINIWILFAGIILVNYLSRKEMIAGVRYEPLMTSNVTDSAGHRIMILGSGVQELTKNTLAGPFLDWRLSEEIFRQPNYYENITMVYNAIKQDPPQRIIDKEDLMAPYFQRMPEIKRMYRREGDGYIRR